MQQSGRTKETLEQARSANQQICVVFVRYRKDSIKSDTRERHTKTFRPIRKVTEGGSVPLPSDARQQSRLGKVSIRIYSGESYTQDTNSRWWFEDAMEVRSSDNETDISVVRATHEEADTGLILRCHHIRCRTAAVLATYADILLVLHIHLVSLSLTCGWYL